MKRRLLDLFCGAGGAAEGYRRAGFEVVGFDIEPQPYYPFRFCQGDVMELMDTVMDYGEDVLHDSFGHIDAIHASPPCKEHIRGGLQNADGSGWLLNGTRHHLEQIGLPWVIENVPGAPMRADFILCGSQFGLSVRRHRWFETSPQLFSLLPPCDHTRPVAGVYGHMHGTAGAWPGMLPDSLDTWRAAMGIDWMDAAGLALAIPPAYTEHIGSMLLAALTAAR